MDHDETDDPQLVKLRERIAQDGDVLTSESVKEWYRLVQDMRERADYYERALIRHLKYDLHLTWREVADAVDANLGSKQAAQGKWKRLIDGDRRSAGSPGRGGWPKGVPRGSRSGAANPTTDELQ